MRFTGRLKTWNAERGFGFIEPDGGGQEILLHLSAVPTQLRPPKVGHEFTFEIELNREGKKRATNVGVERVRVAKTRRGEAPATWSLASAAAIPVLVCVYFVLANFYKVSAWCAVAYVALSIVCFLTYAFDKSAAKGGRRRTAESTLLLLGLVGGWPGGLLAQQLLRHKTSKASFRWAFWVTVLINFMAFVGYHFLTGPPHVLP